LAAANLMSPLAQRLEPPRDQEVKRPVEALAQTTIAPRLRQLIEDHPRFSTSARSSLATRSSTCPQFPSSRWRNSRIVGYHGVVSPSLIHRQSGPRASSIHTFCAIAPAACTTLVSTDTSRSS